MGMPMNHGAELNREIFVLDIDGTLIDTHEIDNSCYWQAVQQVFGLRDLHMELLDYVHVSDSGILDQWCRHTLGRAPRAEETEALRGLFLELIRSISREQPELFQPRDGLVPWLEDRTSRTGTHLAIATGSWSVTAKYKLEFSGLSRFGLPLATADDGISRTDIMSVALQRLDLAAPGAGDHITYVGDGPWDLNASRVLGWSFIGIAQGDRAQALRALGAEHVHPDFQTLAAGAKPAKAP
jgi:phosphoglycolate phosphatase-like HAD superfamily hydrolase